METAALNPVTNNLLWYAEQPLQLN